MRWNDGMGRQEKADQRNRDWQLERQRQEEIARRRDERLPVGNGGLGDILGGIFN